MVSAGPSDHVVVFYHSEDALADRVTDYLRGVLAQDGAAIAVATLEHRQAFRDRLARAGTDVVHAEGIGRYIALDAADVLDSFMVNGWADPASFWRTITPVLKASAPERRPVRVFADIVALLWRAGLVNAAVDVEALWNELATQYRFSLLCGYPAATLGDEAHADSIAEMCGVHAASIDARWPGRRPSADWAGR